MKSNQHNGVSSGLRNSFANSQPLWLASIAAGVILLGGSTSQAALITPITAADVPVASPGSVFDAGNAGNIYSMQPGTSFIPAGFDVHDLFGGSLGTFGPEHNDVIFDNNQPISTAEFVNVTLNAPTSLSSFNLYLEDDGTSGDRSASEFKLFSDGALISDISLLDTSGAQSYTSVYGSNYIQVSDTFASLPASANYTLEFVQNRDGNGSSGIRALEFQASGSAAVPEPSALAGMGLTGLALSRRRLRRL